MQKLDERPSRFGKENMQKKPKVLCRFYRRAFLPVFPDFPRATGSNLPRPFPCNLARILFSSRLLSLIKPMLPACTNPCHRSPTEKPSRPSVFAHSAQSRSLNFILARTIPTSCLSSSSLQGPRFRRVAQIRFEGGPRRRLRLGVTNGSSSISSVSGWNVADASTLGAGGQIVGVASGSGVVKGSRCRGVDRASSSDEVFSDVSAVRFRLLFRVTMV